jgi:hypothetical protein
MNNILINFAKNFVQNVCIYCFLSSLFYRVSYLVSMTSPGWDASLGEHVLKNLRGTEVQYSDKDLQDNLTMLEMKLR